MRRIRQKMISDFLLVIFVSIGIAANAPAVESNVIELDKMTVKGTNNYNATDILSELDSESSPLDLTRISQSEIVLNGHINLQDALEQSSSFNSFLGNGIHSSFTHRGVSLNEGGFLSYEGVPELETSVYSLYNIESVQLLSGGAGFLYGPHGLSGAVVMERKKPLFNNKKEFSVETGSFNFAQLSADLNYVNLNQNIGFRLNTFFQEKDSFRDDLESEQWAINPVLMWKLGEQTNLVFSFESFEYNATPDPGLPLAASNIIGSLEEQFNQGGEYSDQKGSRIKVDILQQISENSNLNFSLFFNELEWNSQGTVYGGFSLFNFGLSSRPDLLSRFITTLDNDQEIVGAKILWQTKGEGDNWSWTFNLGLDYMELNDDFVIDTKSGSDIFLPLSLSLPPSFLFPSRTSTGFTQTDITSMYFFSEINCDDSCKLMIGIRQDLFDFQDGFRSIEDDNEETSPFVGWSKNFGRVSLFANYSVSYGPPSSRLFDSNRSPQESKNFEIGNRIGQTQEAGRLELIYFDQTRDNIAFEDALAVGSIRGEQDSHGVEVRYQKDWQDSSLSFSYTFLDTEVQNATVFNSFGLLTNISGTVAPFSPENSFKVSFIQNLMENIRCYISANYFDKQAIDIINSYFIDDYTTIDTGFLMNLEPFNIGVHIDNLLNEEAFGQGIGSSSVRPIEETNVRVKISMVF